ncbi:MAG: protease modulator HflC [Alphaproteobacteria bacterium]|nr:protease modulator HflC [Alphaproteobacteria bacterium]
MSRNRLTIIGIIVIVLGVILFSSLFTVYQTQQVLVLQFGEPKRVIREPGLNFKFPFIQNVVYYDKRILDLEPPLETVILSDQKRLEVDSYLRYRIRDPLRFNQTLGTEEIARSRLGALLNSGLRRQLGGVTLSDVLGDARIRVMAGVKRDLEQEASNFGIDIVDVRIRRADLPDQAAMSIYARMRSERERKARDERAQGFERSQQIRSAADRERTVILAEARKQAEILRGEGERDANQIWASAFGRDPQFFRFYRSMQAYREALGNDDTTMVMSPDSDFFRYFGSITGRGPAPPAR